MTVYDREVLDAIRYIGKELREIKIILKAEKAPAQITISKDGMVVKGKDVLPDLETYLERLEAAPRPLTTRDLPDLETYFERLEDDSK